ncbi:hypothetical protein D3C80_1587140 [compost metagenome]
MAQRHLLWSGDTGDLFMAKLVQIMYGFKRGGQVVDMHRWQFQLRCKLVGHHHWRQVALFFLAGVERQVGAEQQHAINLFGDDQVNEGAFLLVLLCTVADQDQITLLRCRLLDPLDHVGEKRIADVRDDHQDSAGFIAFDIACQGMRGVTHGQHGLFYFLARWR